MEHMPGKMLVKNILTWASTRADSPVKNSQFLNSAVTMPHQNANAQEPHGLDVNMPKTAAKGLKHGRTSSIGVLPLKKILIIMSHVVQEVISQIIGLTQVIHMRLNAGARENHSISQIFVLMKVVTASVMDELSLDRNIQTIHHMMKMMEHMKDRDT